MKNLLFLSTLFLLITGPFFLMSEDKQAQPMENGVPSEVAGGESKNVTALIGPILNSIAILAKYTFKIAANFNEIKRSSERLKPDVECLTNLSSGGCDEIGCETLSKCAGTTLSDLLKITYPFLEAVVGSVESDGITVKPGSLFAIVDSAEKVPGVIPASLYKKLKAESYKPKVDAVVTKLRAFRDKLPIFTKKFTDAMSLLNGIVLSLNPEMFVEELPIKPLPAVQQLENDNGLSKDIVNEIDAVLALPAP